MAGLLLLAAAGAFLTSVFFGGSLEPRLIGVGVVTGVLGLIGLVSLPAWRDPQRGPMAAAALFSAAALVVAVIALLLQ